MRKRWVKAAIAAAVLVIVVLGLIPFFINADTFRPKIEDELSSSLVRKVTLGHISLSLFTGSLVAENISIADDPAFASTPFLEAKELRIGVELGPLIFHHSVQITTFAVESPSIQLIHAANGTWNFSSLGSSAPQRASQQSSAPPSLTVNELKIVNGSAALSSVPAAGKPFACSDVNLTVKQLSFTQSFPVELSLKVAGGGSLSLKGTAGYVPHSLPGNARPQALRSAGRRRGRAQRRHFHAGRLQCPGHFEWRQPYHYGKDRGHAAQAGAQRVACSQPGRYRL
jgi:AsmA protein